MRYISGGVVPPKPKISRENIIQAAVDIVRNAGLSALTAKTLANRLNCSTQLVFWLFHSMDEVKNEVYSFALNRFDEFIKHKLPSVSSYKSVGLNYIRFAYEETEFFKILFMSNYSDIDIMKSHVEMPFVLNLITEEENIYGEQAQNIYEEMWLFSHGIATMIATGTARFSRERIQDMLSDVYRGLVANLKK